MKNITILLAALMLLSFTFLFAQVPPTLLLPVNGSPDVSPEGVYLVWSLPEGSYVIDSFFDVYLDIDPDFPNPIMFTGPITPSRYEFQYFTGALMEDMVYYWKVRYHAFSDYWTSAVFNFVPGVSGFYTYSTISGVITQGGTLVSGVKVSCPTACAPVQVYTQAAGSSPGSYSFWVRNGNAAAYWVTPTKNWWNSFTPVSYQSNPVTVNGNQTANFSMSSLKSNVAISPWPLIHADEIAITLPQLSWEYTLASGYSPPDEFHIYIPHLNPDYYTVGYVGGRTTYYLPIPDPPLDYGTYYEWWVVPWNTQGGDAEDVPIWDFTTEDPPLNPLTLLSPLDGAINVAPEEITLEFEHSLWLIDSFFDIFVDMDPDFPEEPIYSDYMTPVSGTLLNHNIGPLMAEQTFYWKVRVTQGAEQWTSAVQQFSTTNYVVPTHSVSGTTFGTSGSATGGRKINYYANRGDGYGYVYMGYVNSSPNQPNYGLYTIYLPDINNVIYEVRPVKPSTIQYWSPSWRTYTNLTVNPTGDDYYLNYFTPNPAIQPIPTMNANNVSINIGSLKWSYVQQPQYGTPVGFEVYFPSTEPVPYAVVPYGGRDPEYEVVIPPLEYDYLYDWLVVPYNLDGPAEDVEVWTFETEPYPDPFFPPTLYVYPQDNDFGVEDIGLVMYWEDPQDDKDFPVDSFFDVFLDTDPDFTGLTPIYSGPGLIDPYNPNGYYCYAPPLNLNTTYYWYIKLTLPSEEVHNSPTWSFLTTTESIFNPQPVAVAPGDQANDIEARMTDFIWDLPDFPAESFFDVFCDIDPDFPNPPIYSGPGTLLDPFPDRWIYIHPLLLPNETYYWYVRYTNMTEHYYTRSGTGTFTTGGYFPPDPPILWSPVLAELDLPLDVPLKCRKPVDLPPPDSFFDVFCDIDLAFPNPAVYSGAGIPDPADPELYIFPLEDLLENQTYHWFIRLTDVATGLSSDSEVRFFTTGNFIQPGIPEFLIPPPDVVIPGVIVHLDAGASYDVGYDIKGLEYYWDFGDAPEPPPNFDNIAVQQGYVAKCTVTDVDGDEATGSISIEVDSDTNPTNWYVLSHYSGLWHPGDPYPSFGYGPRLIYLNPPPGGRGEFYIMFVEGDGLDPTLPVELSSFDAVVTSEMFVSLSWVVQSETNLLGYYILRNETDALNSALTLNPSPITEGSALGTQITYQYTDAQVEQNNTYYYWLNSVDLDGTTHFYGPVSVTVTGTDPEEPIPIIPLKTELRSAYPNPFNPNTTIPFNLKAAGDVKIEVFNNKGQLIWRYEEKGKAAGYHSVVWDGRDLSGREISSGVYYYHMTCGKYSAGKKAVLLK